jgi:hypothetical protein
MKVFSPKEKADQLVGSCMMLDNNDQNSFLIRKAQAKRYAKLVVEEILNGSRLFYEQDYTYWNTVKEEIGKL